MPFRVSISYRLQVVLAFCLVAICAQGLAVYTIISSQSASLAALSRSAAEREVQNIADMLVEPLLDRDAAALSTALAPLRHQANIYSASVISTDGAIQGSVRGKGENLETMTEIKVPIAVSGPDGITQLGHMHLTLRLLPADAEIAALWRNVLVAAALVLLVQGMLVWIVAHRITGPLNELLTTIRTLHKGHLNTKVPHQTNPFEVGEVARALEDFRGDALAAREFRATSDRRLASERQGILRALDAAGDAVVVFDQDDDIVLANDRFTALIGPIDGSAKIIARLSDAPSRERLRAALQSRASAAFTAHLLPTSGEGMDPYLDNDPLPVRLRANPIPSEDGMRPGMVIMVSDITEEVRVASRIRRLAEHDTLTGLNNRQMLESRLSEVLDAGEAERTLLMIDLDRFKSINDALGHSVGDELLVHVAGLLRSKAGKDATTVRLGGDEFAILMREGSNIADAEALATRVVTALQRPQQVGERMLLTGASIGIAAVGPDCQTAKEALQMADLALYEAKRKGRHRYIVFQSTLADAIHRKAQIESALRRGLREREVFAVFQRQSDLPGRSLAGFEALARWSDPDLGTVSPGEFIPVAEEAGMIGPLTQHMLAYAGQAAANWRRSGFDGRVSVNVSPLLFAEDVVELIQDALLGAACPADALEIEITEAVFLNQDERAEQQIRRIREMGVTIALDDFGMGYSSLGYLQRFPVDKIKIDRAFVCRMNGSNVTRAIVKAIVEMGHALDMTVCAEGAEDEADVARLVETGVDYVQGFVDGKPMPLAAADKAVQEITHVTQLQKSQPSA